MEYILLLTLVIGGLNVIDTFGLKKNINQWWFYDIRFMFTFFLLAFVSAIRDDVGCDYYSYVKHILIIQSGMDDYMEPGFQYVVLQLAKLNDNPRYVIILMGVLTCFFYLKAIWDQSTNRTLSIFLLLTWGLYFFAFNTIRNYFAISLVFFSIGYLLKDKKLFFILIILFASLFHYSVLVSIPIYLSAYYVNLKKVHIPLMIVAIIALLFLQIPLRSLAFTFYETYEGSSFDNDRISVFNVLKAIFIIGVCLRYKEIVYRDKYLKFYFNLNVFAFILYVGVYWLPEISRIGFCLNMTVMFLFPRLIQNLRKQVGKENLTVVIVASSIVIFLLLINGFYAETNRTLPYKSWLFDGTFDHY